MHGEGLDGCTQRIATTALSQIPSVQLQTSGKMEVVFTELTRCDDRGRDGQVADPLEVVLVSTWNAKGNPTGKLESSGFGELVLCSDLNVAETLSAIIQIE